MIYRNNSLASDRWLDETSKSTHNNSAIMFRTEVPGVILQSKQKPISAYRQKYGNADETTPLSKHRRLFSKRKSMEPGAKAMSKTAHQPFYYPHNLLNSSGAENQLLKKVASNPYLEYRNHQMVTKASSNQ